MLRVAPLPNQIGLSSRVRLGLATACDAAAVMTIAPHTAIALHTMLFSAQLEPPCASPQSASCSGAACPEIIMALLVGTVESGCHA